MFTISKWFLFSYIILCVIILAQARILVKPSSSLFEQTNFWSRINTNVTRLSLLFKLFFFLPRRSTLQGECHSWLSSSWKLSDDIEKCWKTKCQRKCLLWKLAQSCCFSVGRHCGTDFAILVLDEKRATVDVRAPILQESCALFVQKYVVVLFRIFHFCLAVVECYRDNPAFGHLALSPHTAWLNWLSN